MKLRVVIPTLGPSPWLATAVRSVPRSAAEIVFVSPQPIATYELPGRIVRVVRDAGRGLYAALNAGLRAPGEWDVFTWLNDDDRLVADGVDALVGALAADPAIDAAYGRVALIDADGNRIAEIPVAHRGDDLEPLLAARIVPLAQPGTVLRRSVWERTGGLDESYRCAGDLDLFVRALRGGSRFRFLPAPVAEFRLRAGQLSKRSEEVARETERALALLPRSRACRGARWRFRWANRGVYLERLRRHGWASMDDLYQQVR